MKRIVFTPAQEKLIIADYIVERSSTIVASKHNTNWVRVLRILRRHKIPLYTEWYPLTPERRQEVIYHYEQEHQSMRQIAKTMHMAHVTILHILHENGTSMHEKEGAPRKYSINHDALSFITRDTAYWTGFLFADGHYRRRGNSGRIQMGLAEVDVEHIVQWRTFLQADYPIRHYTYTDTKHGREVERQSAVMTIFSTQILDNLEQWGMTYPKTRRVVHPDLAISPDFWRGLIDGDGSVGDWSHPRIEVLGGFKLMHQFLAFVKIHTNTNVSVRPESSSDGLFRVQIGKGPAISIIRTLYQDAPTALERKWATAIRILRQGT